MMTNKTNSTKRQAEFPIGRTSSKRHKTYGLFIDASSDGGTDADSNDESEDSSSSQRSNDADLTIFQSIPGMMHLPVPKVSPSLPSRTSIRDMRDHLAAGMKSMKQDASSNRPSPVSSTRQAIQRTSVTNHPRQVQSQNGSRQHVSLEAPKTGDLAQQQEMHPPSRIELNQRPKTQASMRIISGAPKAAFPRSSKAIPTAVLRSTNSVSSALGPKSQVLQPTAKKHANAISASVVPSNNVASHPTRACDATNGRVKGPAQISRSTNIVGGRLLESRQNDQSSDLVDRQSTSSSVGPEKPTTRLTVRKSQKEKEARPGSAQADGYNRGTDGTDIGTGSKKPLTSQISSMHTSLARRDGSRLLTSSVASSTGKRKLETDASEHERSMSSTRRPAKPDTPPWEVNSVPAESLVSRGKNHRSPVVTMPSCLKNDQPHVELGFEARLETYSEVPPRMDLSTSTALPKDAEPFFEYSVLHDIRFSAANAPSDTALELSSSYTNVDEANAQAKRIFDCLRAQYQQHLSVHFSESTSKRDEEGCDQLVGTFASVDQPTKKSFLKIWVRRALVSTYAGRTPAEVKHTSFISKTVYVLRLFKLVSVTAGSEVDDSATADYVRVHQPHSRTECYTTLSGANRAAKSLQVELSHEPNPNSANAPWQNKNLADLNQKAMELEAADEGEEKYWTSKFNAGVLGSDRYELLVVKVGLCGPRNL
ncbi:hypothetical protein DE146DRAFT_378541 [Phaeosphaeria sp. MPI-PUGE-AT-0046c]|nr:hypothetical protein DE146DRAFT_378541 [Phaeosphaeria sp. MPI-PUGE-AT-0046c]